MDKIISIKGQKGEITSFVSMPYRRDFAISVKFEEFTICKEAFYKDHNPDLGNFDSFTNYDINKKIFPYDTNESLKFSMDCLSRYRISRYIGNTILDGYRFIKCYNEEKGNVLIHDAALNLEEMYRTHHSKIIYPLEYIYLKTLIEHINDKKFDRIDNNDNKLRIEIKRNIFDSMLERIKEDTKLSRITPSLDD